MLATLLLLTTAALTTVARAERELRFALIYHGTCELNGVAGTYKCEGRASGQRLSATVTDSGRVIEVYERVRFGYGSVWRSNGTLSEEGGQPSVKEQGVVTLAGGAHGFRYQTGADGGVFVQGMRNKGHMVYGLTSTISGGMGYLSNAKGTMLQVALSTNHTGRNEFIAEMIVSISGHANDDVAALVADDVAVEEDDVEAVQENAAASIARARFSLRFLGVCKILPSGDYKCASSSGSQNTTTTITSNGHVHVHLQRLEATSHVEWNATGSFNPDNGQAKEKGLFSIGRPANAIIYDAAAFTGTSYRHSADLYTISQANVLTGGTGEYRNAHGITASMCSSRVKPGDERFLCDAVVATIN